MRPFAIQSFAVYLLVLSFLPCDDGGGGILASLYELLGADHTAHVHQIDHTKDCEDDACSPFCVCSCCSITLDSPVRLPWQIKLPVRATLAAPLTILHEIDYRFQHAVWQPPRG